ncbi:MAG: hypothetical protein FJ301_09680 [Planctomycetes bacterium]|nr:hypothetical protein [Planctomycetota bacterium]
MDHSDLRQLSVLERIDLALASRMLTPGADNEPIAAAQRALDGVRQPGVGDVLFLASLLRLRGFVLADQDAADVLGGRPSRLSPVTQEHRLLRGLAECLQRIRQRAADGREPDGWFLVELFRTMTTEMPRFHNNDLRRGPPWDALLYVDYPAPDQLRVALDRFEPEHYYRDAAMVFQALHPVRQGFRLFWRFARLAPFADFNVVIAWLGLNAWLQAKGFPLLAAAPGDSQALVRLISGPPPKRLPLFEARLLASLGEVA